MREGRRVDRLPIEEVACGVWAASMLVIRSTSDWSICRATWGAAPDAEEERTAHVQDSTHHKLHECGHSTFSALSARLLKAWASRGA